MTILNADYDFLTDRAAVATDARNSFRGPISRRLYVAGTELFRMITEQGEVAGNVVYGAFWYPRAEFARLHAEARAEGLPFTQVVRARYAVAQRWNPTLGSIVYIGLTQPVYGYEGIAAPQPIARDSNVIWIGGATQVYIPNLQIPGVAEHPSAGARAGSRHAMIRSFQQGSDYI